MQTLLTIKAFALAITLSATAANLPSPHGSPQECMRFFKSIFGGEYQGPATDFDIEKTPRMFIWDDEHKINGIAMGKAYPYKLDEIVKVVEFENVQLERRFPKEYLDGRVPVAKKFADQSEYSYTTARNPDTGKEEITGSIGITVAEYDQSNLTHQILTMEDSHGWKIDRPLTRNGKGKIIEMRTYGMDPEAKRRPYKLLWTDVHRMIQKELKDYPELWNQNVVLTYGDATSIKMYTPMGFELADPLKYPPVMQDGVEWKVLVSSPKKMLERFLSKVDEPLYATGFQSPVKITANGKTYIAQAFNQNVLVSNGKPIRFTLHRPAEVKPGVWADMGAVTELHPSGRVKSVDILAYETEILPGLFAKKGSYVSYYDDGKIQKISQVARPYTIKPGKGVQVSPHVVTQPNQKVAPVVTEIDEGSAINFDINGMISRYLNNFADEMWFAP